MQNFDEFSKYIKFHIVPTFARIRLYYIDRRIIQVYGYLNPITKMEFSVHKLK